MVEGGYVSDNSIVCRSGSRPGPMGWRMANFLCFDDVKDLED